MSFLQKFAKNSHREGETRGASSFARVDEDELETHLRIARYGSFMLTDAVRPSYDLQVVPRAGFRHDEYKDSDTGVAIPVVMGAASKEILLDLFFDLLEPLGEVVDVVIETSQGKQANANFTAKPRLDLELLSDPSVYNSFARAFKEDAEVNVLMQVTAMNSLRLYAIPYILRH